jgi:hypothetical protein
MDALTPDQKAEVDAMSHEDLCRRWRFGKLAWWATPQGEYAEQRFREFGGFTIELSKKIGWEP